MKNLGISLSLMTTVYTLWYMHFENPATNDGALSTIGLHHRAEFIIWGVLTFITLTVMTLYAYRKSLKTKVYIPLTIISGVGMALTLIFKFDYYIMPDYYFHVVGSLLFSVSEGVTIFLLFLLKYKRNILFKLFTYITAAVLLVDLVLLFAFKETGLIEIIPIFTGYILLNINNFRSDKIEASRKAETTR